MLTTELKNSYLKNGFGLIKGFFSKDDIFLLDEIKSEAKRLFDIQIKKSGIHQGEYLTDFEFEEKLFDLFLHDYDAFLGAAKLVQHSLSLNRMGTNPKIIQLLKDLGLEIPTICVKPILYFNSPLLSKMEGHYKTPPHQDWRSMQGSLNSLVVWMPLCDIDKELGAIELVPGSHRYGLLKSEKDEWYRRVEDNRVNEKDFIPFEVEAGDVLFFSSLTLHRSGNNTTNRVRWSIHFRYNDAMEGTFIDRKYPHPYIVYRPNQELVTPGFPEEHQITKIFNHES